MLSTPFAYVVALIVVLFFLAAAIVAVIIREGNMTAATPAISTLLGLFGPTIGLLVLIIRQQHNIQAVQTVQTALDGHLKELESKLSDASPPASPTPGA